MNKWKLIAPLGLISAAAAGFILAKKKTDDVPAGKTGTVPQKKKAAPVNLASGSYSFVSGFKDAATVDVSMSFDADRFTFEVCEDNFLVYSGDSHVAVLCGENFNLQMEYAAYYQGEGFDAMRKNAAEKYGEVNELHCGTADGISYFTGDSFCVCLPVPEDSSSYILVNVLKAKDSDEKLCEIAVGEELADILGSIVISKS